MDNPYSNNKSKDIFHLGFELGLLFKGIDGLLEIIGGVLLIFLSSVRVNKIIYVLTQHELSEDPKDVVANYLVKLSRSYSISTQYFGVFYLISHGIVKCVIILLLLKKKLWAYPISIISLVLFIIYQMYRFTISHSIPLIILSVFDMIMIFLTLIEYKRTKSRLNLQE